MVIESPVSVAELPVVPSPAVPRAGRLRLPVLLRRAWYGLNQGFRRRISHTGLTPDQFTVLRNLVEGDSRGLTQSALTGRMSSDPNTIAALVERMESAGLVERRRHETDGRARRILIRPLGRKGYESAKGIAQDVQTRVMGVLPERRREAFLRDLALVADACRSLAEVNGDADGEGA